MDDLSLQIAQIDLVPVNDSNGSDSGGRQIYGGGRAKAAGADEQYARRQQLLLTGSADLLQDDVPAVSFHLLFSQ
jgi:hypothetical protein